MFRETEFANKVFHPINADNGYAAQYQDWLLKFCSSISWRSLQYVLASTELTHLTPERREKSTKALNTWKSFILGSIPNPGKYEQHLIPFDLFENTGGFDFPPNMNRYLIRSVEIDVGAGAKSAFVFSKLGQFGIFGFIDVSNSREWEGSKVPKSGKVVLAPALMAFLAPLENTWPTEPESRGA